MSDRRRVRLLRNLMATTHQRSVGRLEQLFGSNVHAHLTALYLLNLIEYDLGGKVRLTMAGRNEARRVVGTRRKVAA